MCVWVGACVCACVCDRSTQGARCDCVSPARLQRGGGGERGPGGGPRMIFVVELRFVAFRESRRYDLDL